MADATTPELGLTQPEVGASDDTWGGKINAALGILDAAFDEATGHNHDGTNGNGAPIPPIGLSNFSAGFPAKLDDDDFIGRAIAAVSLGGLAVTNGDGLAGDPALAISPANATAITSIADDDVFLLGDTSDSGNLKKATRANILKGALLTSPKLVFVDKGSVSGTVQCDLSTGNWFRIQMTGAITLQLTNPPATGAFGVVFELVNPGSAAWTFPSGFKWPGGTAPSLTASGTDFLVALCRDGGATYRVVLSQKDSR